tara:strand:- start:13222 stop:16269 length:3048 start_codon:yes stop_codon:yes gene_type:complete
MTLPKSGKITLSEIVVNFKPSSNSAPHSVSEYYRGGANVSDYINNSNIPTQGRVAWSDYWGAGLQEEYNFKIPELCTDSFHSFCRGVDGWYDLQDLPKEYVGRDDTTASIEIPVYHPQATIEIPSMEFEIDSEMGDDTQFERLYTNRITGEKVFRSGNWTLEIPKKFKRLRIVATAGGSGGSVQKNLISGDLITNKSTKGTVEPLNVGETTEVWSSDFKITVPGGGISDPDSSTVLVFGGIDTSLPYKTTNSPEQFSYLNIDNSKVFKFENKFENNNYPVNMVYKDISIQGKLHNDLSPNGSGGNSLYSTGGIPFPEMSISKDQSKLVAATSNSETLQQWIDTVNAEVLFHKLNKRASGDFFARYLSTYGSYGFLGLGAKVFVGEDSSGNEIFETHPKLIAEVRNARALEISLEESDNISYPDGTNDTIDANEILWNGSETDIGSGAGGRAGQHGGRGSDTDWTTTKGGDASMTAYLGDFETTPGDIINIKVGSGGGREYNQYNEYFSDINGIAKTWSVSGKGGDGSVQLFGSHGRLHSSLTHAGWILEDDAGNVIGRGYSAATSLKGVNVFQNAKTSERYFEVMGTVNPEEPRMYYLRFSARISKNGDFSLKNKLCHIGQKNVKVKGLSKTIFENPPALGSLFATPDTSKDVEDVKGSTSVVSQTDAEIINNWFVEKCNVTFTTTRSAAFTNTAKFTKVSSTDEGVGPDSITFGPNAGTQSFIIAKREVYVLNVSNLKGSGRPKGHNIFSYVRNKTQMQLEDKSGSPDAWGIADLGITISGLCGGGWYVQGKLTYFSGSYTGSTYGKGTRRAHNKPPPPPPPRRYPPRRHIPRQHSGGDDRYMPQPLYSYSIGNTYYNSYSAKSARAAKLEVRNNPRAKNVRDLRKGRGGSGGGGGGGGGGSGKIVCTAMNEAYGFGSFRNKIWLSHSAKHLTKAHQVGYHALFLPLINLGYKKDYKFVRDCLENIARHRTVDIYYQNKGSKRDLLGRIYRFALEPLCYVVGKIILFKRGKNEN